MNRRYGQWTPWPTLAAKAAHSWWTAEDETENPLIPSYDPYLDVRPPTLMERFQAGFTVTPPDVGEGPIGTASHPQKGPVAPIILGGGGVTPSGAKPGIPPGWAAGGGLAAVVLLGLVIAGLLGRGGGRKRRRRRRR